MRSVKKAGNGRRGAELRILDIDISTIPDSDGLKTLAERVKAEIHAHYGMAGPAFVAGLFEHGLVKRADEIRDTIRKRARDLARSAPSGGEGKAARAATALAVLSVAGHLAKKFGLLPRFAKPEIAVNWAWTRFIDESEVISSSPEERAIGALHLWIMQRWNVSVRDWQSSRAGVREAEAWYDDDAIYIPANSLAEAAGGFLPQKALGLALDERGLLAKKDKDGRLTYRYGPRESRLRFYALDRKVFGAIRSDVVD